MDDKKRVELRALAQGASPGHWFTNPSGTVVWDKNVRRIIDYDGMQESNARFIAAANPETFLALLDRLAAVERERDELADKLAAEVSEL